MIKRTVLVSSPAYVSMKNCQMNLAMNGHALGSLPIEDAGFVILENPDITCTQSFLRECAERGIAVIVCDRTHLPIGLMLPLSQNTLHAKILRSQTELSVPQKGALWKTIIRSKLLAQAAVLANFGKDGRSISALIARVRSGDPSNIEGLASRVYWRELFGPEFRRNRTAEGVNALLNYGYAIIRAAVARAIVSTGLHPALGIHHHNQYDPFALADDLMEPLRPLVDRQVRAMVGESSHQPAMDAGAKAQLLTLLEHPVRQGGRSFPLMVGLNQYAASLRAVICRESKQLQVPGI
jgi:CRISPR-associated protein Cas1